MSGIVLDIPLLAAIHRAQVLKAMDKHRRFGGYRKRLSPVDGAIMEFFAEMLPDEGLDILLGQVPKNTLRITTFSLCVFKSQSATTVMLGSDTVSVITETTYTGYARQALLTASWGAQGASSVAGDGRRTTYPQVTFPTVGATGDTVNGIFVGWDTGAGGVAAPSRCIGQANFDDLTALTLVTNDILKVTPSFQINH
jgi:hypothetical protein